MSQSIPVIAPLVIAIDGTAASGKGTMARRLAAHLGYAYLDTGLLYRRVALTLIEQDIPLEDAVAAAREMIKIVEKRNVAKTAVGHPEWRIRIGVHTGEVVAGVVGSKKFAYDIWGDTVNTASRMESNCPIGEINISEATYKLVNQSFNCEYRGEVEVKNKGKMGMYLVK